MFLKRAASFSKYIWFSGFVLWLLIPHVILGQNSAEKGAPVIHNHYSRDYGYSSQNWAVVQDNRGIVYFGNNDGILEFDGVSWRLIKTRKNLHVRSLAVDQSGRVFAGSSGEFGYLAADSSGEVVFISLVPHIPEKDRGFNDIWSVQAATHGVYFFASQKIFRWHDGKVTVIPMGNSNFASLIRNTVYFQKTSGGIYRIDDGRVSLLKGTEQIGFRSSGITIILPYDRDSIWIMADQTGKGTLKKGFFVYHLPTASLSPMTTDIDEFIEENYLYAAVRISEDRYAFGTTNGGIAMVNRQGKLIQIINRNRGLKNNNIHDFFVDQSQNLWTALNKGNAYIEISSPLSLYTELQDLEEVPLSFIRFNNKLYIGSFDGIHYLPEYRMKVKNDALKFQRVSGYNAYCFDLIDLQGHLIGGSNSGILEIDGYSAVPVASTSRGVMKIYRHRRFPNHLFLGLYGGFALVEFSVSRGNRLIFDKPKMIEQIPDAVVTMVADDTGDLWLTSLFNGIIQLSFTSGDPHDFTMTRYGADDGLPQVSHNYVNWINGKLVVATPEGIYERVKSASAGTARSYRFSPEGSYGKILNARSMPVTQIIVDSKNRIWINATKEGMGYLSRQSDGSYSWTDTPFRKIPKSLNKIFPENDGVVWIGTEEALLRFDPSVSKSYKIPFNTLIRHVYLNSRDVLFKGSNYSVASAKRDHFRSLSIDQPKDLVPELDFSQNSLTFDYSSTFFEDLEQLMYRFQLTGFDKSWSDWTGKTVKEYTNLPAGDYCFKVIARNIYGHQGRPASYCFSISHPWYQTVWAYILYVLSAVGIIVAAVQIKHKRLIAAKARLEETVKERTREIRRQNREISSQKEVLEKQAVELEKAYETAQKERRSAELANRAKSDFLARMSHEIRTPMNGVIGFADMLMDTSMNEEQLDYVRTISRSGEALITILNDILDFSKIEAGELTFDPIDFDPELTAFDVCDIITPRIGDRQIEVLCRIGDNVPAFIKTDAGRFRQVIINLMGNAAKFTEAGEIELSIEVAEEKKNRLKLLVKVRDTGVGIPEDKWETIFDVFQQADGSTTRKFGGTGLGLAICRQIARLMEGDVWVESKMETGSTFYFSCWVERSRKKVKKELTVSVLKDKHALILDDNANNLEILTHLLTQSGMRVLSMDDPQRVMEAVEHSYRNGNPIDIGIIDIHMPGMSGFEVAKRIRSYQGPVSAIPLLAFSSSTLSRSKKYRDSGFSGFLPKPIRRQKLITVITRVLSAGQAEEDEERDQMITRFTVNEEAKHAVHILLAEDNPINLKLARFMLEKAGYDLTVARDGEEAVTLFLENHDSIDMIMMDIQMPKMDGRQATGVIREKGFTDVPIIALTAESMQGDRERCLEAGMSDYISKPIKRNQVYAMVKKWVLDKTEEE